MKRHIVLTIAVISALAMAAGCQLFFPQNAKRPTGRTVQVTVSGAAARSASSRGLIGDGRVSSVSIVAKNSGGTEIGTGSLSPHADYWSGAVTINEYTGLATFYATAEDIDNVALYSGWNTVTLTGSGDQISIAVTALSGLVGEWLFAGNANDTSGNGNNGSVTGATLAADRFGSSSKAYSFDGSSQIVVPDADSLDFGTGDFSVSLWAKYNQTSEGTLFSKAVVNGGWQGITVHDSLPSAGQVFVNIKENTCGIASVHTKCNNDSWHHLVCSREGTALRLYVDGAYDNTAADLPTDVTNTADLLFGAHQSGTCPYSGLLDDIRVYGRALSATEIADLYHEGGWATSLTGPGSGLVGEWLFNGNANDTSGNGENGTLNGDTVLASDRFGAANKAYAFDGNGDYIQAAADKLPTADRTVSIWFYANATGFGLFGYGGGAWTCHNQTVNGNATTAFMLHDWYSWTFCSPYQVEPVNRWVHWVVTRSSSGLKLFVDGVPLPETGNFAYNTVVAGKSMILGACANLNGDAADGAYGWFNGRLDDVRIYDRALSASEIAQLYHEGGWPTPAPITRSGLVGEYLFSGNANDTSGGGHDGSISSGVSATADRFANGAAAYRFDGGEEATFSVSGVAVDTEAGASNSVSFWIKKETDLVTPCMVFSWYGTSYLLILQDGYLAFDTGNDLIGIVDPTRADLWYHIVAEFYNGAPDSLNSRLFINGVERSISLVEGPGGTSRTASPSFQQSGWWSSPGYNIKGSTDDLRIYDRALTADEVFALYREGAN